ncbi:MAG TPA: cupin domain-containing protein [Candidatus Dormibacteraeota bacterium]|nr:cupin domain-containing protein [Candidatus Dormibacteraeota bacterium]
MTAGYVADIKKAAKENDRFRNVVFTGAKSQLVLMSLRPGEDIGMEVHDGDQVVYVVAGEGVALLDDARNEIEKGSIVFVPAGVRHNIVNTNGDSMKLFTIYAPPQHSAVVAQRKQDGEEAAFAELEEVLAE